MNPSDEVVLLQRFRVQATVGVLWTRRLQGVQVE